jgi:small-conductance mechanosensitive channel
MSRGGDWHRQVPVPRSSRAGGARRRGRRAVSGAEWWSVDELWVRAVVTAIVWLAVLVTLRWLLHRAYDAWERRLGDTDPGVVARRRTTFSFLNRLAFVIVATIGAWSVLSIFPATKEVASALLASSAVLALIAGLALSTPLGNLGSGFLVAFTQPVRMGDRVTIAGHTGFVEQINMIYTALVTDDERRVFIPNTQLTASAIENRTIRDPRRIVTAHVPIRLGVHVSDARATVLAALDQIAGLHRHGSKVLVGDVTGNAVTLTIVASAPLAADVTQLGSDIREAALGALGALGYLAA